MEKTKLKRGRNESVCRRRFLQPIIGITFMKSANELGDGARLPRPVNTVRLTPIRQLLRTLAPIIGRTNAFQHRLPVSRCEQIFRELSRSVSVLSIFRLNYGKPFAKRPDREMLPQRSTKLRTRVRRTRIGRLRVTRSPSSNRQRLFQISDDFNFTGLYLSSSGSFFFENVINRYTNASDWWKFIIFVLTCTRDHPSSSVCTMELVFGK